MNLRLSLEPCVSSRLASQLPLPPKKYLRTFPCLPPSFPSSHQQPQSTSSHRLQSLSNQQHLALRITSWYDSFLLFFRQQAFPQPQSSFQQLSLTFSPAPRYLDFKSQHSPKSQDTSIILTSVSRLLFDLLAITTIAQINLHGCLRAILTLF